MATKISLRFKWQDIIVIAVSLLMAAAVFLFFLPKNSDSLTVEIKKSGELVYSLPLDKDTSVTVEGEYVSTIEIKDGAAYFSDSTCPNHDCENTGKLTKAGDIAVCLPNRVSVEIKGTGSGVDAVAG